MTLPRFSYAVTCITATSILAACASKSDDLAASYVSPNTFVAQNCSQLGEEAQRLSTCASAAVTAQDKKASNDAAATAVSLVLFWPALFMIKGDKGSAAEVARLKGEMQAVEQASAQKRCNIRFHA